MPGRRWTKAEDNALLDGAGVFSIAWFQKKAGKSYDYPNAPLRSRRAIHQRMRRLLGSGSLSRGTYSLRKASRETGYTPTQIKRAQVALHQKWKRLGPRGTFLITFDQLEEITGWLKTDYWCMKLQLYGCVNCGDSHVPPMGRGLCPRCYRKLSRMLRKEGIPISGKPLMREIQKAVGDLPENRAFKELAQRNVSRGWGMTEDQIRQLIFLRKAL